MTTMVDRVIEEIDDTVDQIREYLASERGVRLRQQAAGVLIAAAPAVALAAGRRMPLLGRVLGTAGVTAAVVKIGERLRDWEPV